MNLEKAVGYLTGTDTLGGTGNELDNGISGNSGDNWLEGGLGNDAISGGEGVDTLLGGAGDDWVDAGDGDDIYFMDNIGAQIRLVRQRHSNHFRHTL